MAWRSSGKNLQFTEGDWGVAEVVTISGFTVSPNDSFKFIFMTKKNGDMILEKVFTGLTTNSMELSFTEEESALFPVGSYVYSLDWYQNGQFMCNLIECGGLKVVDKA